MRRILFFDGLCIMCDGLVDFFFTIDKNAILQFATLQGQTAKELLPEVYLQNLLTVVYLEDNEIYTQSDAILRPLIAIGGFFKLWAIMLIVPKVIRDFFYRLIAKNRYKLFGKKEYCRIPSPEEKERFLP